MLSNFAECFGNVFTPVVVLFIMMIAGVGLGLFKKIDSVGVKQMTNILVSVVTFCVIVKAFATVEYSTESILAMGQATVAVLITTAVGLGLSILFFRKTGADRKSVLQFGTVFSNCGFMGIPVTQAIYGDQGVLVVSVYMAIFQITVWTIGIFIYIGKQKNTAEKLKKIFLNPGVLGVFVGLIIYFGKLQLPDILLEPVESFAAINTPLAMIVTGYFLISFKFKFTKSDLNLVLSCVLRLLVVPALSIVILYILGIRGFTLLACTVPMCAPAASYTVMLAQRFGKNEVFAARLMSICTLLSLATMPIVITTTQVLFPI